jgi:hypothetical protein
LQLNYIDEKKIIRNEDLVSLQSGKKKIEDKNYNKRNIVKEMKIEHKDPFIDKHYSNYVKLEVFKYKYPCILI